MDKKYELRNKELFVSDDITLEEFGELCQMVCNMQDVAKFKLPYWLGDLVNYGEKLFRNRYEQFINQTSMSEGTVKNVAYLCRHTPLANRHDLPSMCFAYCHKTPEEQAVLRSRIEKEDLTVCEAKKMAAGDPNYSKSKPIEAKATKREVALNAFSKVFETSDEFRHCTTVRQAAEAGWRKCVEIMCS